jgi:hypothetical protein
MDESTFEGIIHWSKERNSLAHGAFYSQQVTVEDVRSVTLAARGLVLSVPSKAADLLDRILDSPESIIAIGVSPQHLRERLSSVPPTELPDVVQHADQILEALSSAA